MQRRRNDAARRLNLQPCRLDGSFCPRADELLGPLPLPDPAAAELVAIDSGERAAIGDDEGGTVTDGLPRDRAPASLPCEVSHSLPQAPSTKSTRGGAWLPPNDAVSPTPLDTAHDVALSLPSASECTRPESGLPGSHTTHLQALLDHPLRPPWSAAMSKEEVEAREERLFAEWTAKIHALDDRLDITPFEHNLEVWRQLWRVCEFSDAVLLVADVRYPTFHIPPSLFRALRNNKSDRDGGQRAGRALEHKTAAPTLVIVLNKVDLVSEAHVRAWTSYLNTIYPGVEVVPFSSKPPPRDHRGKGGLTSRRRQMKRRMQHVDRPLQQSVRRVLAAAMKGMVAGGDSNPRSSGAGNSRGSTLDEGEGEDLTDRDATFSIGLIGQPNTGKTTLLNAIAGRKVASTSRTAGHTKHLQHIPIDYVAASRAAAGGDELARDRSPSRGMPSSCSPPPGPLFD